MSLHPEKIIIQKKKNTRTRIFIAALFTTTRTWEQPKCPLTNEWIKKMWCDGVSLSHEKD